MSITVNWVNPNATFDEIRIYRTATPVTQANIPVTPLATLTNGSSYTDETAEQETYYYYTIAVTTGDDIVLTPSKLAYQLVYSGPGPQTLQCGDLKHGYFGTLPWVDLFSPAELMAYFPGLGLPATIAFQWAKFIIDGKILFYPLRMVTSTASAVSWNTLYSSGLVYGIDGPGPTPISGVVATNQLKTITKGNDSFIVRLPRFFNTPDYTNGGSTVVKSEATKIVGALNVIQPTDIYTVLGNDLASNGGTWGTDISWGMECGIAEPNACIFNAVGTIDLVGMARTSNRAWRPLLELVK